VNNADLISQLYDEYHRPEFLSIDPLKVVHRYIDSPTIPEIALVSALFSYGRVPQIIKAIESILAKSDNLSPQFFSNLTEQSVRSIFPSFVYRFHKAGDLNVLLLVLADIRREYGSLTEFVKVLLVSAQSGEQIFELFTQELKSRGKKYAQLEGSAFDWLFPSPSGGSPCKRVAMFFRWMVRENDGIDLGIWGWIDSSLLIIPVDTHVARVAQAFELTTKNSASWKMAEEITGNLRRIDSKDPVRFDFSLCRAGMLKKV